MIVLIKCRCGRNTTYGILCGWCSKNYSPRNARVPEEIDQYDEEPEEEEEELEEEEN